MPLTKFKLIRGSATYTFPFLRPFLTFQNVVERFFTLCYDRVPKSITVNPSELSAKIGNNLGDVSASYNIFGSPAVITLSADRLLIHIPNFNLADIQAVLPVMASIHDGFSSAFPKAKFNRVDADSVSHLDVGTAAAVDSVLNPYRLTNVKTLFGESVVENPVGKTNLVATDQSWACALSVERSALAETAVFAVMNFSLRNQEPSTPFLTRIEQGKGPSQKCFAVFGLEQDNVNPATP